MLTLSYGGGSSLSGVGSPQVQKLQVALKNLALVTGKPIIDPGDADGIVGLKTINAVVASMGLLTKHLGSVGGLLSAGLAIYGIADQAKATQLITQYASQLETAARGAAVAISQGQQSPELPAPGAMVIAPVPWFKTWWGMGALAVGGVGLLAVLLAPRREPKAA